MSRAEKFIQNYTRNCSNEMESPLYVNPKLNFYPWLTPDQARKAVEIAREEIIKIMLDEIEEAYYEGYHQAEKDMELTWKDIADILDVTDVIANDDSMEERLKTMSEEEYCQEVLKRFKDYKK